MIETCVNSLSPITIDSIQLPFLSSSKDLGIFVSSNLKWEQHIVKIVNLASTTSYQILKVFRTKNIWTLVKLFNTYIRPKLEYCTPVWSPYLVKDINSIEKVQRNFTKVICRRSNISFTSYQDRLDKLNMLSLEDRRIRYDLILMFKILNGLSDLSFNSFFELKSSPYPIRNGSIKIVPLKTFKSNLWLNSFFVRAPKYYNKLPIEITSTKSLSIFKSKLKGVSFENLKTQYL